MNKIRMVKLYESTYQILKDISDRTGYTQKDLIEISIRKSKSLLNDLSEIQVEIIKLKTQMLKIIP